MKININQYQKIVFLTGAGVSVASGLKTYRGKDGVWEEHNVEEFGHIDQFHKDPGKVWNLFGPMRKEVDLAEPNPCHITLANLEKNLSDGQELVLITQNVDGLHKKAGSKNVIELHGRIDRTKCSNPHCELAPFLDEMDHVDNVPNCKICGSPLRPDFVMFGEMIPALESHQSKRAFWECDLFVAVGTSGTVSPASNFVGWAEYEKARTVYINLEPMEPHNPKFQEIYLGKAEELLPEMFGM